MINNDFITKSISVHGNKYNYDSVDYVNNSTKVKIKCPTHGYFYQSPASHKLGHGCDKCARELQNKNKKIPIEIIIKRAKIVHGDKYDYSSSVYTRCDKPMKIKCRIHGYFYQRPCGHISGKGCSECARAKLGNLYRSNTAEFVNKSKLVHGDRYDYSKVDYYTTDKKVIAICKIHGPFDQTPNSHLGGTGCPLCGRDSKGEIRIKDILDGNDIKYFQEYKIEGFRYRYDFYLPEHNILIEYDGKQHFLNSSRGGELELKRIKARDKAKNIIALKQNIKLVRIPYTKYNQIGDIMEEIINAPSETSEKTPVTYHAVIYTDGASKNSERPGHGGDWGCGLHGFIYSSKSLGKKDGNKPNKYIITNTGYIETQQTERIEGIETVIPLRYINGYVSHKYQGTNNTGEIEGILTAITQMLSLGSTTKISTVYIKTDSTYAMHILEVVKSDPTRSWYLKDIPNKNYYIDAEEILNAAKEAGLGINVVKVAGHSTSLGNHLADRMALLSRLNSARYKEDKHQITYTDAAKYWRPNMDRHPFLQYKQLFFINHIDNANDEATYVVLDYKKDDEIGKKSSTASFGLVILNDKVPEIEHVRNAYSKNLKTLSLISTVDLSTIYTQHTQLYASIFGEDVYTFSDRGRRNLSILEEDVLCAEVHPPGLAKTAYDTTLLLNNIVADYRGESPKFKYTDISHMIYGLDANGKANTIITQDDVMLDIPYTTDSGHDINIVLQLGNDVITRNQFKRLEKFDTKVSLVTIEKSPTCTEYFTIVDSAKSNDLGIFCNFYSNSVFYGKKKK